MNIGLAFTYQFEDEEWIKKLLLTGLIALIPIVGQIYIFGWMMEIAERFATSSTEELPDIDFGKYLGKGFSGYITTLVYSLPGLIIMIPGMIVPALAGYLGEDTAAMLIGITMVCCFGLGALVSIAASLVSFPAIVEVQMKDLKSGFQVKRMFAILKGAIGAYLLSIVILALAVPIISSLGAIACGIGVIITLPYSISLYGALLGMAYSEGSASLGASESF
ncbi:MAG: DUF4013 domain-containing protein [Anaerolineaceae bacterium]|nr:DUF4013 domain-containing protein [Anaerolineaceae bacterium]